jgi:hypothetical protein
MRRRLTVGQELLHRLAARPWEINVDNLSEGCLD